MEDLCNLLVVGIDVRNMIYLNTSNSKVQKYKNNLSPSPHKPSLMPKLLLVFHGGEGEGRGGGGGGEGRKGGEEGGGAEGGVGEVVEKGFSGLDGGHEKVDAVIGGGEIICSSSEQKHSHRLCFGQR